MRTKQILLPDRIRRQCHSTQPPCLMTLKTKWEQGFYVQVYFRLLLPSFSEIGEMSLGRKPWFLCLELFDLVDARALAEQVKKMYPSIYNMGHEIVPNISLFSQCRPIVLENTLIQLG